jgi:hypothetical protein
VAAKRWAIRGPIPNWWHPSPRDAEHGFRLSPDFEEKIERGYTYNMVPESGEELEVAYDPEDHEQVIVYPPDSHAESGGETGDARGGPGAIRLVGIVGAPPARSADDNAPPPSRP